MPAPQVCVLQVDVAGNGLALDTRISRTCCALRSGARLSMSDTMPDTIGAARLVPPRTPYVSVSGVVTPVLNSVTIPCVPRRGLYCPPGAEIVMPLPKLLYWARSPSDVVEATAMTPGQLAGADCATSSLSLPAATTTARVAPCRYTAPMAAISAWLQS